MASDQAQKSEAHATTDDATSSPSSAARATGAQRASKSQPDVPQAPGGRPHDAIDRDLNLTPGRTSPDQDIQGDIGGGPGAGDASSGGGAGAGIPGGGTDMRMGQQIPEGDVDQDRAKLFPENAHRDDSDFGGPVRIETDEEGNLKD